MWAPFEAWWDEADEESQGMPGGESEVCELLPPPYRLLLHILLHFAALSRRGESHCSFVEDSSIFGAVSSFPCAQLSGLEEGIGGPGPEKRRGKSPNPLNRTRLSTQDNIRSHLWFIHPMGECCTTTNFGALTQVNPNNAEISEVYKLWI